MTDPTTAAPYDAGDAAPAVGYRLPTGDEREQLRAENARLRAELDQLHAELADERDGHAQTHDNFEVMAEVWQSKIHDLNAEAARLCANLERVTAERDAARQLVGELQAALVRIADRLHEIERYARRTSDAEPKP